MATFYYCARWKEICHQHEDFDEHWIDPKTKFDSFTISQEFPIDSVLLMNSGKTLISGSRDRRICVKDIRNINKVDNLSELPYSLIDDHTVSKIKVKLLEVRVKLFNTHYNISFSICCAILAISTEHLSLNYAVLGQISLNSAVLGQI